jgi:hypothetical protein
MKLKVLASIYLEIRLYMIVDCDLYVKRGTLQMAAQDPNVMISRVVNHLQLKLSVSAIHIL